ncbi:ABC transporter permease subunit [Amycolatopsis nigrescens]|uniref:ABC transporter permease subunit n=1 Tax=Amycolatopsis nigrescens TaxID=381445 RepID=UPI0003623310|nr:ABC transporter permease subunit [Amycolatopsis nigrescens]
MPAGFRAELFKLRKRTLCWLIAGVWLAMSLLFGYVFPYFGYRASAGSREIAERVFTQALPAGLVPTSIQGFPLFAGVLALLLGVLCAGGEYGWQTMKVIFTQGPPRLSLLAGKLSALLVLMLVIVSATFVLDAAAAWLVAAVESRPMDWPPPGELARGVLAGWLIVGMWAGFGLFLGFLVRGTAVALGPGLVWALVVETVLRALGPVSAPAEAVQRWFPGTNAGALAAALGVGRQGEPGGTPGVTAAVGGVQAAIVLAGYLAIFAAISAFLLNRRDIT